jgi:hypothetical protein
MGHYSLAVGKNCGPIQPDHGFGRNPSVRTTRRAPDAEIIELSSFVLPNARWISGVGGSASSIRTPVRHAPN